MNRCGYNRVGALRADSRETGEGRWLTKTRRAAVVIPLNTCRRDYFQKPFALNRRQIPAARQGQAVG